ncbi:MAG: hypothetical protein LBP79_05035 [Clostridiales bacterium]|nr:hypothetical protein [Clostridiales bacterium]
MRLKIFAAVLSAGIAFILSAAGFSSFAAFYNAPFEASVSEFSPSVCCENYLSGSEYSVADYSESYDNNSAVSYSESSLKPGEARLKTRAVYFLERTELEFETYGDERVDTVIYGYAGKYALSVPDGEGRFYIYVYWTPANTDGFSGGGAVLELNVTTDGNKNPMTNLTVEVIFYDAEFPYADGSKLELNNAPIDWAPKLNSTNADDGLSERFAANVGVNTGRVSLFLTETVAKPVGNKDPAVNSEREELDYAYVFPGGFGVGRNMNGLYNVLYARFGEELFEYLEISLKIEYYAAVDDPVIPEKDLFNLLKTINITVVKIEKFPAVRTRIREGLKAFIGSLSTDSSIGAAELTSALGLDEAFVNSFDGAVAVCKITRGGSSDTVVISADLKNPASTSDAAKYKPAAGEYTFSVEVYFGGNLFCIFDFKQKVGLSVAGILKISTIVAGSAAAVFIALSFVAVVYRKRRHAGAAATGNADALNTDISISGSDAIHIGAGNPSANESGTANTDAGNSDMINASIGDDYGAGNSDMSKFAGANSGTVNAVNSDTANSGLFNADFNGLNGNAEKLKDGAEYADLPSDRAYSGNGRQLKEKITGNINRNSEKTRKENVIKTNGGIEYGDKTKNGGMKDGTEYGDKIKSGIKANDEVEGSKKANGGKYAGLFEIYDKMKKDNDNK